jgi:HEAT repeat protein
VAFAFVLSGIPTVLTAQVGADITQAIESAKALKSSGKAAEAVEQMAAVLKKHPSSLEASTFQIDTLIELDRFAEALKTYDGYVAASKKPDAPTLARLGRADLARTARTGKQPILLAQALERLGRMGDADAITTLRRQMGATSVISPESLAPTIALARLKDPAGEARLAEMLNSGQPNARAQVVQAITEGNLRSQAPKIIPLLSDPDINVRNASATALGALQAKQAIPQLRSAFENDVPAVKMFAAVSLKRLGDASADKFLEELLNGQIAELRVIAAGAYQNATTKTPAWDKAVKELLAGANDVHKLRAAELLATVDPAGARAVLTSALGSPNPLLRGGAAKVFESHPELADLTVARRLIGDPAPAVRVYGAGLAAAISARARSGAPARH